MYLSVVSAVYNGERFLRPMIESVLGQTLAEFEFIIVNDGSTDSTDTILAEYMRRDSRLIVLRQDNRGPFNALNRGISQARHELIAHVDADDRMLPTRLERQLAFFRDHPQLSVICSNSFIIDVGGKRIGQSVYAADVARGRRECNPALFVDINHSSVMMKKTDILAVGGYRGDPPFAEDRDLWGRLVTAGYDIGCQPEFLVETRLHGGSISMRSAFSQSEACRYIDTNIVRRLRGQPEFSLEEYRRWARERRLSVRFSERRQAVGTCYFKMASRHYVEGRWVRFAAATLCALCLRPHFVAHKLRAKRLTAGVSAM